ncbi:DUF4194 domain-containing protein [uncultured Agathobaculum sp.]|uniref:DUF4194 domain-containing protein n=1 Tax=uncultured Agathobaculum sp. TaxID=2048140 RepID=UPI00296E3C14
MFETAFEKLTMTDQERFRRIVNMLLAQTFLLQTDTSSEDTLRRTDPDYLFAERNFSLLADYLAYAGFTLEKNDDYGVIALHSAFDFNRRRLDKFTTQLLFTLRLIYDEEREKLSLSKEIFTTTGDITHKMMTLGVLTKKPANQQLHEALRTLAAFRLIAKTGGAWEDAETAIRILPSVLFVITGEQITSIAGMVQEDGTEETEADA